MLGLIGPSFDIRQKLTLIGKLTFCKPLPEHFPGDSVCEGCFRIMTMCVLGVSAAPKVSGHALARDPRR
jgi:hypothetical protein